LYDHAVIERSMTKSRTSMLSGSELGARRASLVSAEEPVQCIHVRPTYNIDCHAVLPDIAVLAIKGHLPGY